MSTLRPIVEYSKTVNELIRFLGLDSELYSNIADIEFSGVCDDSREAKAGDLYFALPGARTHGAFFVKDLVKSGISLVITDKSGARIVEGKVPTIALENPGREVGEVASWFYENPFAAINAVGITGTNGKTTTATLLNQLWQLDGRTTGFVGTVGIFIDREEYGAKFTTPQACDLQSTAATMKERHVKNFVMEVSSHAIAQNRIGGSRFVISAFTNLTQDHLDFHGTMESYFSAKAKLFTSQYSDCGIVNIDGEYGYRLAQDSEIEVQTLSRTNPKALWHYVHTEPQSNGVGYQVAIRGAGGILIEGVINLIGSHNLDNVLMATALAVSTGVDPLVVASNLHLLTAPPGRLEVINMGQKYLALVDYAHTPDAVERALSAVRPLTAHRIIAVLGCGGDRDAGKRSLMGDSLIAGADIAIFTSDNPRGEDPAKILDQMMSTHSESQVVIKEIDRRGAIAIAVSEAQPGDCVLLLGKGHELGQEIAGIKYPFDDRIELARAIEEFS